MRKSLKELALKEWFNNLEGNIRRHPVANHRVTLREKGNITPEHLMNWARKRGFWCVRNGLDFQISLLYVVLEESVTAFPSRLHEVDLEGHDADYFADWCERKGYSLQIHNGKCFVVGSVLQAA